MTLSPYLQEVAKRRTFAIISHPDAGKTTITEKVLLFGQAIQTAGTVKGRGSNQHAKSDWMEMEKQRGISITTSVMQFPYHDCLVNLLDTPGHEDFSEDTYRTLTAVDCCLMVIDAAKGVEDRTRKLMEVTRLRDTPILTFMNKLDRDIRDPMELLDEVENELKIGCAPITWPIGCGKLFKGVYHLYKDETYLYQSGKGHTIQEVRIVKGLNNPDLDAAVGEDLAQQLRDELELVKGASNEFDKELFLAGWVDYQNGAITSLQLQHGRFESWAERLKVEAGLLNDAFINAMAEICTPLPGAVSLLNAIRGNAKIGIITNGFSALQQVRLERTGLRDYFDLLVISEEVGVAKPNKKIFDYALEQAGNPDRSRVLMVGDTAESDILGGINAGLATCWLNAHHREQPEGIAPTWTVSSLHELEQLLCKH